MTYLAFHLTFILPPIAVLVFAQQRPIGGAPGNAALKSLGLIAGAAFLYTILWDNYLVYRGVWTYPIERVVGRIAYVPIEEYAFFVLQPLLGGLFYFALRSRRFLFADGAPGAAYPAHIRGIASSTFACIALTGISLLIWGGSHALYLGLILVWCGPVLTGLMWIGVEKVWSERRLLAVAIGIPTVYLWIADRIALSSGIWHISEQYSLGLNLFGLPLEEAVFFLVTNWMAVQGIAMLMPSQAT